MTTTPAETAAYVAASIALGVKSGDIEDVLSDFDKAFNHVLSLINDNSDNPAVRTVTATVGPRNIPVVSQEDIKAKVAAVSNAANPSGLTVHGDTGEPVSNEVVQWAKQNGLTHIYDNRAAHAENPKRPLFKAVDARGHDIKGPNGKTVSFWANSGFKVKDDTPMPDAF
jgi:hypothetical protein